MMVGSPKTHEMVSYWRWFFVGSGRTPGYRRLTDRWLIVHIAVGILAALALDKTLQEAANTVLLPLAGIFVGLSFAWAGNAQAILQSREMYEMTDYHEGGFVEYPYVYQTAILAIMVTLVLWGLAGLDLFDHRWPTSQNSGWYCAVESVLYAFSSLTLRECWQVVLGAQWMLIAQRIIRRHHNDPGD